MSKRIVFCADGTWDTAQDDTNVYKLFKAIPISSDQMAFYDDGVGSNGTPIEKLLGGAFGDGLFQKIKDGYTKISHVYEQGDDIFLFGFSRGAFTARSLAGMIALCGLPTAALDDNLTEDAFAAYRNRDPEQRKSQLNALIAKYQLFDAPIKMVGVWDTVGSLGVPALAGKVDPIVDGFLDTGLHSDVKNAYQALAIDERRREFPPTLWTVPSPPIPGQVIEQVWFCGAHCDVGGGYSQCGLADITLSWMMGKAKTLDLEIEDSVWQQYASLDAKYALGQLHESWSILWGFPRVRPVVSASVLSNSVPIRCQYDDSYKPVNLTADGTQITSFKTIPGVVPPSQGQGSNS